MKVETLLCLIFGLLMLLSSSQGFKFDVGGREGWVLNPSENYNHWAERNRFQVNDTLSFKFKKENDLVLLVSRENYNQCNINNPIKSLTGGEADFKFERSGPHYFISGNEDHCKKGQKLIIVVLAIRPKKTPPSPPASAPVLSSPSPSPAPSPPASITPSRSPSDADAPGSSTNDEKSFALSVTALSHSVVTVSVATGVAMFLGCFGWMVKLI